MIQSKRVAVLVFLVWVSPVRSQVDVLDFERPEAWAMAYATAATLYHGLDVPDEVEPWALRFGAEIGNIPKIDAEDQRVGFDGTKLEDLNKSPVFGRGRLWLGLPADFTLEFAYTPPVRIDGVRADDFYALAIGRPLWRGERWRIGARIFGQSGQASGDITCSREVAALGVEDFINNPFGCRGASDDEVELDYYGLELSAIWQREGLSPLVAWSVARIHPEVQVNAPVFDTIDRTRLVTEGTLHTGTLGVEYRMDNDMRWVLAGTYTPLDVVRGFNAPRESDDFWSIHLLFELQPRHLGF